MALLLLSFLSSSSWCYYFEAFYQIKCFNLRISFSDKCFVWHGRCWAQQDHIPWTAEEEGAPLCDFQDRWEEKRGCGWKNWRPSWELRWFHCFFAREWLPICNLWLWLCDFWELPEEQDIFYCMVSLFLKCSNSYYSIGKQAQFCWWKCVLCPPI